MALPPHLFPPEDFHGILTITPVTSGVRCQFLQPDVCLSPPTAREGGGELLLCAKGADQPEIPLRSTGLWLPKCAVVFRIFLFLTREVSLSWPHLLRDSHPRGLPQEESVTSPVSAVTAFSGKAGKDPGDPASFSTRAQATMSKRINY